MMLRRFVHLCCCGYLLLAVIHVGAAAQVAPVENRIPRSRDFKRLAEIFSPPESPGMIGKAWVAVNRGPDNFPVNLRGWLIEEDAKEILLLDWYGELHKLRRPASDEKRPKIKIDEDGTFVRSTFMEADFSVAWKVRTENYAGKSKKFLADGLPKDKDFQGIHASVSRRFTLADHVVDAARYAHFAHRLKQKSHAADLYTHARKAQKKYAGRYVGNPDRAVALHVFVANHIASGYRNGAIVSAHGGLPRKELQKRWERFAAIPHHKFRTEAKAMVEHYKKLSKEDARWVEPDAKALAKMTTEKKVAYWLYHLRDLDMGQWSNPGSCSVFGRFGFEVRDAKKKKPNAAVELKKLGMAAVPQLIAHLDDARPTRCKGHWRSYWPEGHYLLRYGDCCQQIFESITGHTIFRGTSTVSYPIHDKEEKRCKEKARKWWQEHQKKAPKTGDP